MRAHIRDTEIYFDVDGAALVAEGSRMRERRTAVLIHGGPGGDHTGLIARYGQLREKMQLIYFDQRGQGRSTPGDPRKYTLDENVEDLEALRLHLGLGPVVSLGTSYGGMVAMLHAARYPDSVSHLVLVATAAHAGFIARSVEIVAQRGTSQQLAMCTDLWAGRIDTPEKMREYLDVMGPLYSCRHDPEAARARLTAVHFAPETLNQAYGPSGSMRAFDLRPKLGAITAPTLIIAGRHDWICPPEFSAEIHRLIPNSDLRVFEHSSHSIGNDEGQDLLDAVAGFVIYKSKESFR
jgi:proline iminopeptidase